MSETLGTFCVGRLPPRAAVCHSRPQSTCPPSAQWRAAASGPFRAACVAHTRALQHLHLQHHRLRLRLQGSLYPPLLPNRTTAAFCTWTNVLVRQLAWLSQPQFEPKSPRYCGLITRNGLTYRGREGLSLYKPKLFLFAMRLPQHLKVSLHPPRAPISPQTFPLAPMSSCRALPRLTTYASRLRPLNSRAASPSIALSCSTCRAPWTIPPHSLHRSQRERAK